MTTIKKNDYVELKYTGYANGEMFDSNIEEDLKKLNPKAKPNKTIIIVGQGMIVSGLDKALEEKEIGKEYEIKISAKEGFGDRKRELVKTIPLKIFTEKKINPYPGMVLNMDNILAKVITVSGARVITDFNNPLSGKELKYKFKIIRKVDDEKEKVETVLGLLFKFVPEFEIGEKIVVKGPKILEQYINSIKEKFKELVGKEISFKEKVLKEDLENLSAKQGFAEAKELKEEETLEKEEDKKEGDVGENSSKQ